jgi:hypothetical protein
MAEWDPRKEMGPLLYLLFKCHIWVSVDTVPEWVKAAEKEYYHRFQDEYGHRPYDQMKVFVGNSLKYRVTFETVEQGKVRPSYEVKLK